MYKACIRLYKDRVCLYKECVRLYKERVYLYKEHVHLYIGTQFAQASVHVETSSQPWILLLRCWSGTS